MNTLLRTIPIPIPIPMLVWLGLLALSLTGLLLGDHFGHRPWMPLLVAVIIWVKGSLVLAAGHHFTAARERWSFPAPVPVRPQDRSGSPPIESRGSARPAP
jgi:hypothetical protein